MSTIPPPDRTIIAVRAWAPPLPKNWGSSHEQLPPSTWTLIFDTETLTTLDQQLRVGTYQIREAGWLREVGLFYDPDTITAEERDTLQDFAVLNGLELMSAEAWVDDIFFALVYDLGGLCIGFNLPWDLSRVAWDHSRASREGKGGFSLRISHFEQRPKVQIVHRSGSAARIRFVGHKGSLPEQRHRAAGGQLDNHRGHFLDVAALAKALTGSPHSLASLCELLDTPTKKIETEHGGRLDDDYLRYAVRDPQATWECAQSLTERFKAFSLVNLPATRVYSEASLGKAVLRAIGVRPWLEVQRVPHELTGIVMSSYFGGRAEVRARHELCRVEYCDFQSMYPTNCTLLGLWSFLSADGIAWSDATEETRIWVNRLTVDDLQRPETWHGLPVLVQVQPTGQHLPVRAVYGGGMQFGIAINHLTSPQPIWVTLADCIQAKLLGGEAPEILRAIRFAPRDPQPDLEPINLLGNPEYRIDPYKDDLFARIIDQRAETRASADEARATGDTLLADRLDAEQKALKTLANATSYGAMIELNVRELSVAHAQAVFSHHGQGRMTCPMDHREDPGEFFHPLLATLITGGARLLLALAETIAQREGLDWAFMDTDSIALVKPDHLTDSEFEERCGRVRAWFRPLNPYRAGGDLLQLEDINHALTAGGNTTSGRAPLWCLAISPKRYALFNIDAHGRPLIRKASAHGLGHLTAPYTEKNAPATIPPPAVKLSKLGISRWHHDFWYLAAEGALNGRDDPDLDRLSELDYPVRSRCAITTPGVLAAFSDYNQGKPYREQLRPFGFFSVFPHARLGHPTDTDPERFRLVAPFDKHPANWADVRCKDLYSGTQYEISPYGHGEGVARVPNYRGHLRDYWRHPDPKRLGPDGRPCNRRTKGRLQPRHIHADDIVLVGKEISRLQESEAGLLAAAGRSATVYDDGIEQRRWELVVKTLQPFTYRQLAAGTGVSPTTISALLTGRSQPTARVRRALLKLAREHAAAKPGQNQPRSRDPYALLRQHLDERVIAVRSCPQCSNDLPPGERRYCTAACKQKAYRRRKV